MVQATKYTTKFHQKLRNLAKANSGSKDVVRQTVVDSVFLLLGY